MQYLRLVGEQSYHNVYAIGEQYNEDVVSISSDDTEDQYLHIESEDEYDDDDDDDDDDDEIYPAEQIIAKQLHQVFINYIYEFIEIYNEFVGNP
jgi:hypothetical protein